MEIKCVSLTRRSVIARVCGGPSRASCGDSGSCSLPVLGRGGGEGTCGSVCGGSCSIDRDGKFLECAERMGVWIGGCVDRKDHSLMKG